VLESEMKHLNNKKKSNSIVTAATLFTLAFFVVAGVTTSSALGSRAEFTEPKAPVVVSGDNI
jgi:hypothetical protein